MSRIEIISASAGTGKTTRLAKIIADRVGDGSVRPEAVLATTFTKRAAAELAERARSRLLEDANARASTDEAGARERIEKAQRLHAARIGTVNSVCGGLVQDFAFEQGLAPRVAILDETQAKAELSRVAGQAVPPSLLAELAGLEGRLGRDAWEWKRAAETIVDLARTNAISPEALSEMVEDSVRGALSLLSDEEADGKALDTALEAALVQTRDAIDLEVDTTKTTADALAHVKAVLSRGMASLDWPDWVGLSTLKFAKKSEAAADGLHEAASAHDRHPRLKQDLADAIRAVFQVARATLEAYQEHKARLGVIDFIDQETYALDLLKKPEIRARLAEEIDLVLVDEFQDTSPIQLAIFLELSEIAPQTVWVGDPKQAIYGFRGADPALMEAAVEKLLEGDKPETLRKSFRSRPGLVELTSDLFAPAFAESGIDEELVRIESGIEEEPEGLGPMLERWVLDPGPDPAKPGKKAKAKQAKDFASLAAGVAELLAEPDALVRDRETRAPRPLRPGDIGILCFTNDQCVGVADELARRGIRAVVGRPGLLKTLEARLALAAVSLWLDPSDRLARAELARWLGPDPTGEVWLEHVLKTEAEKGEDEALFADVDAIAAVVASSGASPGMSVLATFDAAVAATGIREAVLGFGEATARLANLDALRGLVGTYVERTRGTGQPVTARGLLTYLVRLAESGDDDQSAADRPDAVRIGTWHAAKGLEWPITVLADIKTEPAASALGVNLVSESGAFSIDAPLSGRTIRYWPSPYGKRSTGIQFLDRLGRHPATTEAQDRARREALRLLYVGWTRARDRLVLAARPDKIEDGRLAVLSVEGVPLVSEPNENGLALWGVPTGAEGEGDGPDGGVPQSVQLRVRTLLPTPPASGSVGSPVEAVEAYVPAGPHEHPAAFVSASSVAGVGSVVQVIELGERLAIDSGRVRDETAMRHFGEAVHGFLAADRASFPPSEREAMAVGLLERWGVAGAIEPAGLIAASDRLADWVRATWLDATERREWPLEHRLGTGTVLRGTADLVLEMEDGFVVIDHKSFPGDRDQAVIRAAEYAGQLSAYVRAIEVATGKLCSAAMIHLPISGVVVSIDVVQS